MTDLAGEVRVRITADASGLGADVNRAGQQAARQITSTFQGVGQAVTRSISSAARAVGQTLATGLQAATVAATGLAAATVTAGVAYNQLGQQSTAALTAILGTRDAAEQLLGSITELGSTSPFPRQVLIDAGRDLAAFGVETDRIVPTLDAMQQAIAAIGGGAPEFDRLSLALGQVAATGRLSGEELRQMAELGIPAAQILAKEFGITGDELRDRVSEGAIDAETAINALADGIQDRFGGATEQLFQTITGGLGGVQAALRDIGSALVEPFIGFQEGGAVVTALNTARTALRAFVEVGEDGSTSLAGALAPLSDVLDSLAGHVVTLSERFAGFLSGIDASTVETIVDTFRDLGPLVAAVGAGLATSIGGALPILGQFLGGLNPIVVALGALVAASPDLRSLFGDLASQLAPVAQQLGAALLPALQALLPAVTDLLGRIAELFADAFVRIGPALTGAIGPIAEVFGQLADSAAVLLAPLITTFVQLLPPLLEVAAVLGGVLVTAVDALAPVMRTLGDVAQTLAPIWADMAATVGDELGTALVALAPVLGEVAGILGDSLSQALTALAPVLEEIAVALAEGLGDVLEALAPQLPGLAAAFGEMALALADMAVAVAPLLPPLIRLATVLLAQIGPVVIAGLARQWRVFATVIRGVAGPVGAVAGFLSRNLEPALAAVVDVVQAVPGALSAAAGALQNVFGAAVGAVVGVLGGLLSAVGSVVAQIPGFFAAAGAAIQTVFAAAVQVAATAIGGLLTAVTAVANVLAAVLQPAIDLQVAAWNLWLTPLTFLVALLTPLVSALLGPLASFLTGVLNVALVLVRAGFVNIGLAIAAAGITARFVWDSVLTPFVNFLIGVWNVAFAIGRNAVRSVGTQFSAVGATIQFVRDNILAPVANFMVGAWNLAFVVGRAAVQGIRIAFSAVGSTVQLVRDNFLQPAVDFLQTTWTTAFSAATGAVSAIVTAISNLPSNIRQWTENVRSAAAAIGSAIGNGLKNAIVSALSGAVSALGSVGDFATAVINGVIGAINNAIGAVNDLISGEYGVDTPFGFIGFTLTDPIPTIPTLAMGGIFTRPLLAQIAEAGPEVVIPLSRPGRAMELMLKSGLVDLLTKPVAGLTSAVTRPTGTTGQHMTSGRGRHVTYNDHRTINLNSIDGLGEADVKRLNNRLAVAATR